MLSRLNLKQLKELLVVTLYISAFTFGGGFVIVTFMKKKFVDEYHWIEADEMLDLVALAQSAPGAIAVNAAILVGWHVQGFIGMLVAVVGTITPPLMIISVVAYYYQVFASNPYIALMLAGMQAGVAAVILDIVCELGAKHIHQDKKMDMVIMVVTFIAVYVFKLNIVYIILVTALLGVILAYFNYRKEANQ